MIGNNAKKQIASFVDRVERLDDEIKGLREDRKDLLKEAKSAGFNDKAIEAVVKRRREDEAKREKRQTLENDIDLYMHALGMTPLEEAIETASAAIDKANATAREIPVDDKSRPFASDDLELDRRKKASA